MSLGYFACESGVLDKKLIFNPELSLVIYGLRNTSNEKINFIMVSIIMRVFSFSLNILEPNVFLNGTMKQS